MGNGQHVISKTPVRSPQSVTAQSVTARPAGGRPALLEIAALRLLTDPVFGTVGSVLGAAQHFVADESQPIHVMTLSHHRYGDGIVGSGRRLFATVPVSGSVKVTWVPAQCGPDCSGHITGRARDFMLTGTDMPSVYISGGNMSPEIFTDVADRFARSTSLCCRWTPPTPRRRTATES
ncbi:hypothetical protein [Streptomyces acidicola]|uniref:hypothetical protein n=1 Tax=Streptomyces acidicola TaxID=2596892 RepID=UPI0038258FBA